MVESIWDVEFQETFLSALTDNVNLVLSFLQLIPVFLSLLKSVLNSSKCFDSKGYLGTFIRICFFSDRRGRLTFRQWHMDSIEKGWLLSTMGWE